MMAEARSPQKTSSTPADITQPVMEDHERIRTLFQQYLASQPDSRQVLVKHILRELTADLEMGEELVFSKIRKLGSESLKRPEATAVEHEEIKAMILELQQAEGDDDQERDEVFEDYDAVSPGALHL